MKTTSLLQKLHLLRPTKKVEVDWERCLPVEVLERIFGHIADERDSCATRIAFTRGTLQPTLHSAALVCRVWYDIVTKYLYNEIYLSSTKAMELLANALVKNKHLPLLVQQFYFSSKVYASGNAQMLCTAKDIYNLRKIHEVCPNLNLLVRAKPWTKVLPADDDLAFRAIKLDRAQIDRLTHMEIAVPNSAFFGGRMAFSSSVEFPALQELYVTSSWRSYNDVSELDTPQWFRMPQLRRLSMLDFTVRSWQTLTFPEHSPLINTIELLRGDYEMVSNLFDPLTSPLLPYKKTLESLTITAKQLGEIKFARTLNWFDLTDPFRQSMTKWSLGFLESLVELCVPFRSFTRIGITSYPPHLKDLVLAGYLWDMYEESADEKACGFDNLKKVYKSKLEGRALPELKRVQILVRGIETWVRYRELDTEEAGVELKLGIGRLYGFKELRSDLVDIGMKKISPFKPRA